MKVVGIAAVHCGPVSDGAAYLAPVKAFGPPVMDMMGPMPYMAANMMLDATFVSGDRYYWKSHFLPELSEDAMALLIDLFAHSPTEQCQIIIEHFHGAVTRLPIDATAYALREPGYNVLLLAQWTHATDDDRVRQWCRDGYARLKTFGGPRRYANYMDGDDMTDRTLEAVYGPNLPRLRQVKRVYDPDNVFHRNLNIPPA